MKLMILFGFLLILSCAKIPVKEQPTSPVITTPQNFQTLTPTIKRIQKRKIAKSPDDDEFPPINVRGLVMVDDLGIPFGDTVLSEQRSDWNTGANNLNLQDDFVLRFAHLAESFSPDLYALGMEPCYTGKTEGYKSDYRQYQSGPEKLFGGPSAIIRLARDLWASRNCFFQRVRFADFNTWQSGVPPKRKVQMPYVISLFLPNVLSVDLDTNGTWPLGHRPSDQIGGRFVSLFLKMGDKPGYCGGSSFPPVVSDPLGKGKLSEAYSQCHLESLIGPIHTNYFAFGSSNNEKKEALPLQPPKHVYITESGERIEGFREEEFPFMLPPNKGRGYFQSGYKGEDY